MTKLQRFDFDESHYERPGQKWICGNAAKGKPCQKGPSKAGKCNAGRLCYPDKIGDRWVCTRSTLAGGKCSSGPLSDGKCGQTIPPCQPIRNLRSKRTMANVIFVLTSIIFISIILFSSMRDKFVNPGPLSFDHSAQVQTCESCHEEESLETINLLSLSFANQRDVHSHTSKCLKCHDLGISANQPHNMRPEELAKVTQRLRENSSEKGNEPLQVNECHDCHKEHRGKNYPLKMPPNERCASCHINKIVDFETKHTEFNGFAYQRRTRIIFDHNAHFFEHFEEERIQKYLPVSCDNCHTQKLEKGTVTLSSFNKSCIKCHKNDVTAEGFTEKGIAFFRLPAIDVETLTANGFNIGQWPDDLEDEELTPFMLFYLSKEKSLVPILKEISNGNLNLAELEEIDVETLSLVEKLVWETKRQLLFLAGNQNKQWVGDVERLLGSRLGKVQKSITERFLPKQELGKSIYTWIPDISLEIVRYNQNKITNTRLIQIDTSLLETNANIRPGQWYIEGYSLFYRPKKHNDDYLRTWLDSSNYASYKKKPLADELFHQLSDPEIPGQCMRCHSVDRIGKVQVLNWQGKQNPENQLTIFSHTPHVKVIKSKKCDNCHILNEKSDYMKGYTDFDLKTFDSNFDAVKKKNCITCHTKGKVGEQCVSCHKYHRGKIKAKRSGFKILGS